MTNTDITPFVGVGSFLLLSSFNTVKTQLELVKCGHTIEIWPNKGCTPQVEWKIIHCDNHLNLFFAKDKLFKIYVDGEFPGKLPNGIYVYERSHSLLTLHCILTIGMRTGVRMRDIGLKTI